MDIKKLKVDESQINKLTGRIILPADEVSPRPAPRTPHPVPHPTPHPIAIPVAHPSAIPVPHPAVHQETPPVATAQPAPFPTPRPQSPSVSPVQGMIIGILITLLIVQTSWLFWSHSQVQESIRTMHDQIVKLHVEVTTSNDALKSTTKEIADLKALLTRSVEEQKTQAKMTESIKAQIETFDNPQ